MKNNFLINLYLQQENENNFWLQSIQVIRQNSKK